MAASGSSGIPNIKNNISTYLTSEHINQLNQMGFEFKNILGKGSYGAAFRCESTTTDDHGRHTVKQMAAKVFKMKYLKYSPHLRHRTPQEMEDLQNYEEITLNYTVKGEQIEERVMWRKAGAEHIPPHMIENPMSAKKAEALRKSVDSIERELQAMVRANHTNVIKLENVIRFYDEYTTNPYMASIVIFMELAEEGDLFDYLDGKTHTEHETKQMMAQICCGVEHLHSRGIAHMDLKTENILVFKDQHNNMILKITDFGLSILYNPGDTPVSTELLGTLLFVCPVLITQLQEIRSGERHEMRYDPTKVDIWALGVITLIICYTKDVVQSVFDIIITRQPTRRDRFRNGFLTFARSHQSSPELIDLLGQVFEDQDQNRRIDITQFCEHQWIRDAVIAHNAYITPQTT